MRFILIIAVFALITGCENSSAPVLPELSSPQVTASFGADPDGVGIEKVTDVYDNLILPGAILMDNTPVIVTYCSGRVEKTTWGNIKDRYAS